MYITKWIEKNSFNVDFDDVIEVDDLRELLKTHTLVPNEPTEAMLMAPANAISDTEYQNWTGMTCSLSDAVYKAMLEASKEEE